MFCALEKFNGCQKFVSQLIVKDDTDTDVLITDQKGVETEISSFYEQLYQNKDNANIESIEEFLGPQNCQNIPKLNENQKSSMNGKISVDEMTKYLKKCTNNVSPGSSDFTN